ncbi:MAG: L,D-transpeptidase family protein [Hyphomicrobiaceae bacterium]|nr:L,D-transpeptidase family protein [Hyphomicrobiaceae bacterium]
MQIFSNSQPQKEERRQPEPLADLRTSNVPLRSDVMVEALEKAVERYQQLASAGGWPAIPAARSIRLEDDDERLPLVRKRLAMSGELQRRTAALGDFTGADDLETAVRRYQENNGLRPTGRLDKYTLQTMNVSAQSRLQQLRINLSRLRDLLGQRLEDRYIVVNAAAFQLEAVERFEVEQRHRVIVGKPDRQTPTVKAQVRALNFYPYWRVPESVASLDLIPKLQREPDYLQKEQIRVLTGSFNGPEIDSTRIDWRMADAHKIKFRQDPGPQNALGLLRLDMPNEHGVYMHDTPMKQLFNSRGRSFSAGCVRVQDVFKLGEWIARNEPGWGDPGRVRDVIDRGQPLDLTLARPVPVYFTYITAWAEPDGRILFRPDIYGRDGVREANPGGERDPADGPAPAFALAP